MRQRMHYGWIVMLLLAGCLLAVGPVSLQGQSNTERPIMAFYYPWYEMSDWTYERMSDLPVPQYSGGEEETLIRHIEQAEQAGITTLICTWYGPDETRLNERCQRLQDLMIERSSNLQIAIIPDQSAWQALQSVSSLADALAALKTDFISKPNYLRFQGRPAVFWFNPPSLGDVATWQALRAQADPNREMFWFGGTDDAAYLNVYDTLYFFDITWERSPGAAMASYAQLIGDRPFIATVMPGYDDLRVRNGHQRDRENGAYYRGTWQDAMRYPAEGVVLTSFNEFFEGTHIEPSEQYGDLYLRLTGELSAQFRQNTSQPTDPTPTDDPDSEQGCRYFEETGYEVCGRLLQYWTQNDGLRVFGLPITPQQAEVIEGQTYQVQWFERNRLELHPENNPPYDVLLGRLGADVLEQENPTLTPSNALPGPCYRIPGAQFDVCGRFLEAWRANGLDLDLDGRSGVTENENLALFGLPLTPTQTQLIEGEEYVVQWFERARFEYHPEFAPPNDVLFGLLGNELRSGGTQP